MSKQIFTAEKIIFVSLISKDLITDSVASIPDVLSKLFWDGFKDCILRKKALPMKTPDIQFVYLLYHYQGIGDNKNYTIRITTRALRLKTRGRRSNQFRAKQLNVLTKCKDDYINLVSDTIKTSGILS